MVRSPTWGWLYLRPRRTCITPARAARCTSSTSRFTAASGDRFMRSPDLRSFTSISPLFSPFGPDDQLEAAGRSDPWSRTCRRRARRCRHRAPGCRLASACRRGRRRPVSVSLSPAFRLMRPTSNGATGTGQTMPDCVVAGLDDGTRQARHADPVRAHLHRLPCSRPGPARGSPSARSTWCRRRKYGRPRCRVRTPASPPALPPRSGRGRASRRWLRRDWSTTRSAATGRPRSRRRPPACASRSGRHGR